MTPARISAALDQVERDHDVRILLAIESGSRAWGFPSRDSDWDVRFIYVHTAARYLSIAPPRDVIEAPLDGDLDLGGWDLRKALFLMVASNAIALEWLASPIVYRHDATAHAALGAFASRVAQLPALAYHYDRLARRTWPPADPAAMKMKHQCYALRAACAVAWLRRHATQPPMSLPALIVGLDLPAPLDAEIHRLIALKQVGTEADAAPVPHGLAAFIETALLDGAPRPAAWDRATATEQADTLFRQILHGGIA